ncbi:hypothetical protein K450DRAFT_258337 [Umbelopsis ramanniana AG]|uniref:MYND-type domain-containing protein n=1 Tax=Umbelopsis ramanniana AG TaxID=1314678 RepID=A0AAD5H996_UMBRA|nr:uncharacterized protein K450DRAFT_258337 [Umbelopsis ramanniana AG]KAI8576165.1 hypothetical protein K450DRAFT_258337 [Umbelopsis ramanniana AG]
MLPIAAQQLASEYEKKNSVAKKLERANMTWSDEYELLTNIQQQAVERLSEANMDVTKATADLSLGDDAKVTDLLLASFLYGGVREEITGENDRAKMSPVASPNFKGAKALLERVFAKKFSMAGVQIGSLYVQEDKLAGGANCTDGTDPKKEAYDWYLKAAKLGNPMAQHKVAFYLERGYGCQKDAKAAIEWYEKACAEGYPDSAHNLAILYQAVEPVVGVTKDLKKAVEYFEKAKQWGFAPASNALGRMYLLMSKDMNIAKEAGIEGDDEKEFIVTGISLLEESANGSDADAMTLLGMIFGSKEYGLYDLDKSQSFFELALVRGDLEAYPYLVRILRAKMAAKAALEKQNMENFEKMDAASQQKLIQQLAKDASAESITLVNCSNPECDKKESSKGEFSKCSACKKAAYCSRACQKEHWKNGHKAVCSLNKPTTA